MRTIFPQKGLCETEGGQWYGPVNGQGGYGSCCALVASGQIPGLKVLPLAQSAVRNDKYKLIQVTADTCDAEELPLQLYRINEAPVLPLNASRIPLRIDFPFLNLIKDQNNPTQA
jgi:hypothetical protein